MERKRIFVGGLFADITEDELRSRFSKFGEINGVEIKLRNNQADLKDDYGGAVKTFAYIDIDSSDKDFKRCISTYNKTRWKGSELKLQLAKDNFMDRLQKERENAALEDTVHGTTAVDDHDTPPHRRLDDAPGVYNFHMRGAKPGTLVSGEKNWIVGKYGSVLPVMHMKTKGHRKILTIDPSKYTHNIKRMKEENINHEDASSDSLTWEMNVETSEMTKLRQGEFPSWKPVTKSMPRPHPEEVTIDSDMEEVPLSETINYTRSIAGLSRVSNGLTDLSRFDSDSELSEHDEPTTGIITPVKKKSRSTTDSHITHSTKSKSSATTNLKQVKHKIDSESGDTNDADIMTTFKKKRKITNNSASASPDKQAGTQFEVSKLQKFKGTTFLNDNKRSSFTGNECSSIPSPLKQFKGTGNLTMGVYKVTDTEYKNHNKTAGVQKHSTPQHVALSQASALITSHSTDRKPLAHRNAPMVGICLKNEFSSGLDNVSEIKNIDVNSKNKINQYMSDDDESDFETIVKREMAVLDKTLEVQQADKANVTSSNSIKEIERKHVNKSTDSDSDFETMIKTELNNYNKAKPETSKHTRNAKVSQGARRRYSSESESDTSEETETASDASANNTTCIADDNTNVTSSFWREQIDTGDSETVSEDSKSETDKDESETDSEESESEIDKDKSESDSEESESEIDKNKSETGSEDSKSETDKDESESESEESESEIDKDKSESDSEESESEIDKDKSESDSEESESEIDKNKSETGSNDSKSEIDKDKSESESEESESEIDKDKSESDSEESESEIDNDKSESDSEESESEIDKNKSETGSNDSKSEIDKDKSESESEESESEIDKNKSESDSEESESEIDKDKSESDSEESESEIDKNKSETGSNDSKSEIDKDKSESESEESESEIDKDESESDSEESGSEIDKDKSESESEESESEIDKNESETRSKDSKSEIDKDKSESESEESESEIDEDESESESEEIDKDESTIESVSKSNILLTGQKPAGEQNITVELSDDNMVARHVVVKKQNISNLASDSSVTDDADTSNTLESESESSADSYKPPPTSDTRKKPTAKNEALSVGSPSKLVRNVTHSPMSSTDSSNSSDDVSSSDSDSSSDIESLVKKNVVTHNVSNKNVQRNGNDSKCLKDLGENKTTGRAVTDSTIPKKVSDSKSMIKGTSRYDVDKKRQETVLQRHRELLAQKSAVQKALASLDNNQAPNKKIVFESDDEDEAAVDMVTTTQASCPASSQRKKDGKSKSKLFANSSDEDNSDDGSDQERFKLRPEFEGTAGKKLMKLQSKYGNDERFRLDSRFMEPDSDDEQEEAAPAGRGEGGERERSLKILQEVMGDTAAVTLPRDEKSKKTFKDSLHYDPTKLEHSQFEVKLSPKKPASTDKKLKKSKSKKTQEAIEAEVALPVVSSERFHEVSESIKDTFTNKSATDDGQSKGFSLLAAFGRKEDDSDEEDDEIAYSTSAPLSVPASHMSVDSRFHIDSSSDSEADDDGISKDTVRDKAEEVIPAAAVATETKRTTFFFLAEDKRLKEGLEFYCKEDGAIVREKWMKQRPELIESYKAKQKRSKKKARTMPFKTTASRRGGRRPNVR